MSFNYSHQNLDQIPQKFDRLLLTTPETTSNTIFNLDSQNFKKEIEIYTRLEAREILIRLIEKSKVSAERKNWKVDETNYLLFVIDKYCLAHHRNCQQLSPLDWKNISELVPNRDSSACEFRYLAMRPKSISHAPWSSEERQLLLRIIQNQNSNSINWKNVSEKLYELSRQKIYRTGKQCREHYTCFLRPNLKKGAWTDEQDYLLMNLFLKMGKKWSKMTKQIEGRNQNSIKNRFFLMFESKNEVRSTNSDLMKMVRRRKQKIQKKIIVTQAQKDYSDQNIHTTPTNSDSSNHQSESLQQERQRDISFMQSEIFYNEYQPESESNQKIKIQENLLFESEEFQRYIDL